MPPEEESEYERGRGYELDNRLLVFGNKGGGKQGEILAGIVSFIYTGYDLVEPCSLHLAVSPRRFQMAQGRQLLLLRWRAQNSEPSRSFVFFCPEQAG